MTRHDYTDGESATGSTARAPSQSLDVPESSGRIFSAIAELDRETDVLTSTVEALARRLGPVLRPATPSPEEAAMSSLIGVREHEPSEIEMRIETQRHAVVRALDELNDLIARLEV